MYFDRIHRRLVELAELGCLEIDDVEPSTIDHLMAWEKKLGFRVPASVHEFYSWGGDNVGNVFCGMEVLSLTQQLERDYRTEAREILEAEGGDPASIDDRALIMQMNFDGQFSFVRAGQQEDPQVFTFTEQEPIFCSCERFSDYLALLVEQHAGVEEIELVRSVDSLHKVARVQPPRLYHLLFAGGLEFITVPEDVFALKELRSLNLVGKGLVELSPRVSQLSFLKRLDLARNSLTSLPMALTQLTGLQELDLADNELTTVLDVLRKLPSLRYCCLAGNPVPSQEIDRLRRELPQTEIIFARH